MEAFRVLAYPLAGFLLGSIPFSWIIGKFLGSDIRDSGSGNIGATNLFRTCGRKAGIAGLALDAIKGVVPVLAARYGLAGLSPPSGDWVISASAVAAVLGHLFTPWLGFRGGKGVATTLGALLVLSPLTVLTGLSVFIAVVLATRYISLGSISGALAVVPAVFVFRPGSAPVQIVICAVAALVILRHRSNISKLVRGEESRFEWRGGGDD